MVLRTIHPLLTLIAEMCASRAFGAGHKASSTACTFGSRYSLAPSSLGCVTLILLVTISSLHASCTTVRSAAGQTSASKCSPHALCIMS